MNNIQNNQQTQLYPLHIWNCMQSGPLMYVGKTISTISCIFRGIRIAVFTNNIKEQHIPIKTSLLTTIFFRYLSPFSYSVATCVTGILNNVVKATECQLACFKNLYAIYDSIIYTYPMDYTLYTRSKFHYTYYYLSLLANRFFQAAKEATHCIYYIDTVISHIHSDTIDTFINNINTTQNVHELLQIYREKPHLFETVIKAHETSINIILAVLQTGYTVPTFVDKFRQLHTVTIPIFDTGAKIYNTISYALHSAFACTINTVLGTQLIPDYIDDTTEPSIQPLYYYKKTEPEKNLILDEDRDEEQEFKQIFYESDIWQPCTALHP